MRLAALVFDAYGTLFDVHSVVRLCDDLWPGKGPADSQAWRTKQLEYTWLRSLMNRYEDFSAVTEDALRYACASLGLPLDAARIAKLMAAYRRLSPFPDVAATLARLGGHRLAILSNGSPSMLEPLVVDAGLDAWITDVLSVDAVKTYKPAPVVYELAVDRLGVPAHAIGFVSSNGWDACGAKAFGFEVFWINRTGAPRDALGTPPDHVIAALADLPPLVGA